MSPNCHAPSLDEPTIQYLPPSSLSFTTHYTDKRGRCQIMKTDPAIHRLSRVPAGMNRPVQSPMGPRTRFQRSATVPENSVYRDSLMSIVDPSPAYPLSPARSEAPSLPPVMEQSPTPPPTSIPSSTSRSTPSPTPPSFTSPPPFTPTPTPPPNNVKVITKPLLLPPVHKLTFESVPVQFKALTHEVALWTFDSDELRELVSRALRRSTPDTYIRLLSLDNLKNAIPAEINRLQESKAAKQARYQWLVQRRQMTLQALNTCIGSSSDKLDAEDGTTITQQLLLQLSQTSTDCDKVAEELLVISDQLSQLSNLTERHWASALAVALRKLNKAYAKRTSDLDSAQQKNAQLEAELEEAWKEAEKVAKEIDEIEKVALDSDDEEPVIEMAEKIDLSRPASRIPAELFIQSRTNTQRIASLPIFSPLSPMPRASIIPTPETPVLHPAAAVVEPPPPEKDDAVSVLSTRSMRSTRSWKNSIRSARDGNSRLSLVSAAKTRSHRASKSSLRYKTSITPHPPMPELPYEFMTSPVPFTAARASSLWAGPDGRLTPGRSRRTSFDDIRPPRKSVSSYTPTVTMDDIYVRLQNRADEIEVVPRTPPLVPFPTAQPSKAIPSMWLMADTVPAPKPSLQPAVQLQHRTSSSKQAYKKLKILTQRYSLHFPLFKNKSSEPQSLSPTTSRSAPVGVYRG